MNKTKAGEHEAAPTSEPLAQGQAIGVLGAPTMYVNQIFLTPMGNVVKIVFLENAAVGPNSPAIPRCSIAISPEGALALRDMITKYVDEGGQKDHAED